MQTFTRDSRHRFIRWGECWMKYVASAVIYACVVILYIAAVIAFEDSDFKI